MGQDVGRGVCVGLRPNPARAQHGVAHAGACVIVEGLTSRGCAEIEFGRSALDIRLATRRASPSQQLPPCRGRGRGERQGKERTKKRDLDFATKSISLDL